MNIKEFNPDNLRAGDMFNWYRNTDEFHCLSKSYQMFSSTSKKFIKLTTSLLLDIDNDKQIYTFLQGSDIHKLHTTTVAQHKFLRELIYVYIRKV